MSRFRRTWLQHSLRAALALGATFSLGLGNAQAASTTKILVGFPAGGGSDAIARILAERMQIELGSNVVVDNKPGAGGQIAAQALKAAAPDGQTLFLSHDHSITILPMVTRNPGYDSAKDFVPVAGIATFVNAFAVSGGTTAKTFQAYVAQVKQQGGGKGVVGIPAPGSVPQFLVQVIARKNGLDLVAVPYRGSAPMMSDMLGNQIPAGVASIPDFIENHKAGKVRVVAVMGTQRQASMPEVPTLAELGLSGFEEVPFYGVFAPAGTPKATLDKLALAIQKTIAQPDVRDKLTTMGLSVGFMSSDELAARERSYAKVWAKIIQESGYQPN
ncbi:Bug family tripartite tricarboxylate transporter substrate binding protein [Hydrogenophaga sp. PAMC20947]|uniref:Bug family tripartite tricarboxylate transporter substrate binding protein n=1 Tax=Hydrogenophaga sp. PAMC20947 TaxID=2565558 RepID=UPI00109DBBD1|nr:Bug family tripartite tricarboxylate transporter substrate binding protein [Hydrogenophaga sp. PAMC20947]QCB44962.1 Twin-arginine translocation pathway signal [Hydrogenophaga sp. PAMC20947]